MENLDLLEMNKTELNALHKRVTKAIKDYDVRKKAEARLAAEALAKEHGFALSELLEAGGAKGSKGSPKYANPSNTSQTWTGRGRKPKWVEEHLSEGGEMQELVIA